MPFASAANFISGDMPFAPARNLISRRMPFAAAANLRSGRMPLAPAWNLRSGRMSHVPDLAYKRVSNLSFQVTNGVVRHTPSAALTRPSRVTRRKRRVYQQSPLSPSFSRTEGLRTGSGRAIGNHVSVCSCR
jgi:hypothetical protein